MIDAMKATNENATATYLGVPSLWVLAVSVPALAATIATQTLFWGLVALLFTMAAVVVVTAARGTVALGERSWFGVPALVAWVAVAVAVSGGQPTDEALFSVEAAGLATVILGLDALVRGKFG